MPFEIYEKFLVKMFFVLEKELSLHTQKLEVENQEYKRIKEIQLYLIKY
jgi:hypothetical protein